MITIFVNVCLRFISWYVKLYKNLLFGILNYYRASQTSKEIKTGCF